MAAVEMVRKHGTVLKMRLCRRWARPDAEEVVVEGRARLEQEASLKGPGGDGDEGVGVGYAAKFLATFL
jgi:hypothetical protein